MYHCITHSFSLGFRRRHRHFFNSLRSVTVSHRAKKPWSWKAFQPPKTIYTEEEKHSSLPQEKIQLNRASTPVVDCEETNADPSIHESHSLLTVKGRNEKTPIMIDGLPWSFIHSFGPDRYGREIDSVSPWYSFS